MTQEDWTAIQDIDQETWRALPKATRRAIETLRELREEDAAARKRLREEEDKREE